MALAGPACPNIDQRQAPPFQTLMQAGGTVLEPSSPGDLRRSWAFVLTTNPVLLQAPVVTATPPKRTYNVTAPLQVALHRGSMRVPSGGPSAAMS